eukprot:TRINITY_DN12004_c0_g1_i1.p1 TRINITY_DN12004_c0_g1~~TRINITY_DN12004_c0_g1_i1.p1  ORF type:complete len:276 (+),score=55.88 TRINITY_DN12004_c0_g1_i1:281-1108(+)
MYQSVLRGICRICLYGRPYARLLVFCNVAVTTWVLMRCYFLHCMARNTDPTCDDPYRKHTAVDNKALVFEIMDTAFGCEYCEALEEQWIRCSEVVMLTFSLTSQQSLEVLSQGVALVCRVKGTREWRGVGGLPCMPMVVCGNMADLVDERAVSREAGEALARRIQAPYFEVSAKTGVHVERAFHQCVREWHRYRHESDVLAPAADEEAERRRIAFVLCAQRGCSLPMLPMEMVAMIAALVEWHAGMDVKALEAAAFRRRNAQTNGARRKKKCAVQ